MANWWMSHNELYAQVPMKHVSVLPDEGFEPRPIVLKADLPPFMVSCDPKGSGRPKHRVQVLCSCGRKIPFGRMGQHHRTHNKS